MFIFVPSFSLMTVVTFLAEVVFPSHSYERHSPRIRHHRVRIPIRAVLYGEDTVERLSTEKKVNASKKSRYTLKRCRRYCSVATVRRCLVRCPTGFGRLGFHRVRQVLCRTEALDALQDRYEQLARRRQADDRLEHRPPLVFRFRMQALVTARRSVFSRF